MPAIYNRIVAFSLWDQSNIEGNGIREISNPGSLSFTTLDFIKMSDKIEVNNVELGSGKWDVADP